MRARVIRECVKGTRGARAHTLANRGLDQREPHASTAGESKKQISAAAAAARKSRKRKRERGESKKYD